MTKKLRGTSQQIRVCESFYTAVSVPLSKGTLYKRLCCTFEVDYNGLYQYMFSVLTCLVKLFVFVDVGEKIHLNI